ncbi:ankyrin repeat-containing domain protein [Aspergillus karnatakaensis]|uniref:ankyrin repeat-containing domain protein n=1 Tax=Aspergillus karnatakaensis TaxID=1810916 RepID=UPI003CCCEF75
MHLPGMTPPMLPPEIILLVLKQAVEVYTIPELFQARLVNTTFADELFALLIRTDRLENERFTVTKRYRNYWTPFPERLKRQYLKVKIDRYHERPCSLSELVHLLLDKESRSRISPGVPRKNREIRIQHIIDALVHSRNTIISLLDPDLHEKLNGSSSFYAQNTLQKQQITLLRLFSAIWRDDPNELKNVLQGECGSLFITPSFLFGTTPLHLIAFRGTKEIMEAMLLYADWNSLRTIGWQDSVPGTALKLAIRSQNRAVLDVWLQRIHQGSKSLSASTFARAFIEFVRVGDIRMVQYLNKKRTRYTEPPVSEFLHFHALMEAVMHGHVDIAAWLHIDSGTDVDLNQVATWDRKGPLFAALQDCPPNTRLEMIKMLLGGGVDPNHTSTVVRGTPLQAALQQRQDRDKIVQLFLEHGADPNARVARNVNKMRSPLLYAARQGDVELLRRLFELGADPRVVCRRLTIVDEAKRGNILKDVKEMLVEFGWKERFSVWLGGRRILDHLNR